MRDIQQVLERWGAWASDTKWSRLFSVAAALRVFTLSIIFKDKLL